MEINPITFAVSVANHKHTTSNKTIHHAIQRNLNETTSKLRISYDAVRV